MYQCQSSDTTIIQKQNIDDKKRLSKLTSLSLDNSTVIQGSGVNLSQYQVLPQPNRLPIVLLAARLLVDKGVRGFVQAEELVNKTKMRARFVLVGDTDEFNPASIKEQELSMWKESSSVDLKLYSRVLGVDTTEYMKKKPFIPVRTAVIKELEKRIKEEEDEL